MSDYEPKHVRHCTSCVEVGEKCPDCAEHLDMELAPVLFVNGHDEEPNFVFLEYDEYLKAVKRGAP